MSDLKIAPKIAYIFLNYFGHSNMFYTKWPEIMKSCGYDTCPFSLVGPNHRKNVSPETFYFEGARNVISRSLLFFFRNPCAVWDWVRIEHKNTQKSNIRRWAEYGGLVAYDPTIIHLVNSTNFLKLRTFDLPKKFGLVSSFHGYDLVSRPYKDFVWRNALNELFAKADSLHFVSKWLKTRALELGADETKCKVIYTGVDSDFFKPDTFKPKSEKIRIVSIGRLIKIKGFDYAIQAIACLVNIYPNIEYRIIGSGEELEKLTQLIQTLKLEKNVFLLGFKSKTELRTHLNQTDIYLQPSLRDTLPGTVLEAASMGLPIVASQVGGIPEIIYDEINGLLTLPEDVESIVEGVKFLIRNPNLATQLGLEARQTVLKNFSLEVQTRKMNVLYESIINSRGL